MRAVGAVGAVDLAVAVGVIRAPEKAVCSPTSYNWCDTRPSPAVLRFAQLRNGEWPIKQPSELLAGSASGLRRPTTSVKDANSATVASLLLQLSTRDTEAGAHFYSRRRRRKMAPRFLAR